MQITSLRLICNKSAIGHAPLVLDQPLPQTCSSVEEDMKRAKKNPFSRCFKVALENLEEQTEYYKVSLNWLQR